MKFLILLLRAMLREYKVKSRLIETFPSTVIEANVVIKGDIRNLKLGKKVMIQSGTVIHLGGLEWCENTGSLEIGEHSVISPNTIIYGCGPGGVQIGKRFDCGPGVGIFSSRTDYLIGPDHHVFAPILIGDDVTIFANAVINPGVTIGNGAVIAACSVVTRDVLANTLVGGCPARLLKENIKKLKG